MTREISKAVIDRELKRVQVIDWHDDLNGIDRYEVRVLEGKHKNIVIVTELADRIEYVKDMDLFEELERFIQNKAV